MVVKAVVFVALILPMAIWGLASILATDYPWHGLRLPGLVVVAYFTYRVLGELFAIIAESESEDDSDDLSDDPEAEYRERFKAPSKSSPRRS